MNLTSSTPHCPSHRCWRRFGPGGGVPGGRVEGVVGTLLIVELGSPGFFGKHDGCAVGRDNSAKKYGTPPNKVCLQTKSGAGNTMVMSELTGGVNGLGLLVFLMCSTYGRYINPDNKEINRIRRSKLKGVLVVEVGGNQKAISGGMGRVFP